MRRLLSTCGRRRTRIARGVSGVEGTLARDDELPVGDENKPFQSWNDHADRDHSVVEGVQRGGVRRVAVRGKQGGELPLVFRGVFRSGRVAEALVARLEQRGGQICAITRVQRG